MSAYLAGNEYEAAIDAVVASYLAETPINHLESAALPNKAAIIDGFRQWKALLFLGYTSTIELRSSHLRHHVAEAVESACNVWRQPIDRALAYSHWQGRDGAPAPRLEARQVLLRLLQALPTVRALLATDVQAAYDGDPAAESIEEIIFSYPSIEALATYRIAHQLRELGVPMLPRILSEHTHSTTGIDIHPAARIGSHFFIDHGTGVVVGASAVIGEHVKLYQSVTLGALSVPERGGCASKRHPTLEDRVTIYAGATILGGDTVIGHDSVIGGNVCLVDSVPPYSKILGRDRTAPYSQPPEPAGAPWE